ncbi:MAG: dienelactone hydrolase family protein [Actinobacteria bacterium]|nr:dienelactone hydrolase family protein [Actinomycetota bacterium]
MRIALPSGTAAEVAVPDGPTRGLVLAPDIMGLRPLFDDHVARLAAEHSWAVAAVEPYPGREDLPLDERLSGRFDATRMLTDLIDAADHLGQDRTAVLGFCQGGMTAFRAAGTLRFDKAVSFYGMVRPPAQWSVPGADPLDMLAKSGASPTLAIVAGKDRWAPPADVEALRALPNVEVAFYPEADHGFVHDASRDTHRAADAANAWRRLAEFLA